MTPHWSLKYIGLPYLIGARGPESVDCWGLLRMVYKQEFKITLPLFPGIGPDLVTVHRVISQSVGEDWVEVPLPFDGAAVGMSQRKAIHHVGLYTTADGGKIIHSWDNQLVVADTTYRIWLKGFKIIRYYRHVLWDTLSKPLTPTNL